MSTDRLDQYVALKLPSLSRTSAAKLIEQGRVLVNGVQQKPGYRLKEDDSVDINYDEDSVQTVANITIPTVYEDEDCVVISKPAGLLSHSKGVFNPEPTVATWLASRTEGMTGDRAGIVHRLDRSTSGVMIVAKTPAALAWLQKQFSTRKVKKTYVAVVEGRLKNEQAVIDMPIERHPKKPQTFRAGSNGKPAITEYQVLKSHNQTSLLELKPVTGRTHQLRVHLKQIGHPIIGDALYGGRSADRLYLHATALELTLPNKERRSFSVSVPPEFNKIIEA